MILLFIVILAITLGIASGLRFLLPSEYYSAAFWGLQLLSSTVIGIWNGIVTFKDRWEKKGFTKVVLSLLMGFLLFVSPAWLGINFGFGIDPTLSQNQLSSKLIEGLEGLVPALASFYIVAFFIGWITTRIQHR